MWQALVPWLLHDAASAAAQAAPWNQAMASMEEFEVVSFVTSLNPTALMRTNLLPQFPLKVTLLGLEPEGSRQWKNLRKVELLHQHVASLPPSKVVIAIDFFDVVWLDCQQDLVQIFRSFDRPLVFSAEVEHYPIAKVAMDRLEEAGGYPHLPSARGGTARSIRNKTYKWPRIARPSNPAGYLNSGCFAGYANALHRATGRILAQRFDNDYVLRTRLALNDAERESMLVGSDDQIAWHTYAIHHPGEIALDYGADMFLSALSFQLGDFELHGREVFARPFGHSICFAHGNGASNMAAYVAQVQNLARQLPGLQPGNCSEVVEDLGYAKVWQLDCRRQILLLRHRLQKRALETACSILCLTQLGHSLGWMAADETTVAALLAASLVLMLCAVAGLRLVAVLVAMCCPRTQVKDASCNVDLGLLGPGSKWPADQSQVREALAGEVVITQNLLKTTRPKLEFHVLDYVAKASPLEPPHAVLLGPGRGGHHYSQIDARKLCHELAVCCFGNEISENLAHHVLQLLHQRARPGESFGSKTSAGFGILVVVLAAAKVPSADETSSSEEDPGSQRYHDEPQEEHEGNLKAWEIQVYVASFVLSLRGWQPANGSSTPNRERRSPCRGFCSAVGCPTPARRTSAEASALRQASSGMAAVKQPVLLTAVAALAVVAMLHRWAAQVPAFLTPNPTGLTVSGTRHFQSSQTLAGPSPSESSAVVPERPMLLPIFAAVACAASLLRAQVQRRARGKPQTTSGIRVRKPKNNALRNSSLTTKQRYEPLCHMYRRRFARPRHKPIMMATRTARESGHNYKLSGGNYAKKYRVIDFGRTKRDMFGKIQTIEYDPYRNARICLVKYEDGEMRYILHAVGYFVGQEVISSEDAPIFVGHGGVIFAENAADVETLAEETKAEREAAEKPPPLRAQLLQSRAKEGLTELSFPEPLSALTCAGLGQ
eukprot:s50_g1.t1